MTLIAYKDGILCADTLAVKSDLAHSKPIVKIARRADGALFASSGYLSTNQSWMQWFLRGQQEDAPWRDETDNYDEIAIIYRDGSSDCWCGAKTPERLSENIALGHSLYLSGLMDAGLSATEAVKFSLRRCRSSSYPLIEIGHSGPPTIWASESVKMDTDEFPVSLASLRDVRAAVSAGT